MSEIKPLERSTPANIDAEQLLLGAIITNNEVLNQVGDLIIADHFYEPIHQKLYKAISSILEKGLSASVVSLSSMLSNDKQFAELGGKDYLARLSALAVTVINSYDHARLIHDYAIKRKLISVGEKIVNETYTSTFEVSAENLIGEAEADLFAIATEGNIEKGFLQIKDSLKDALTTLNRTIQNKESVVGLTTGYNRLDKLLYGFQNSDLVILAGRPSMGKTAFALNLAMNAAENILLKNKDQQSTGCVGFFSLEMSSEQITTRMLSMFSSVDSSSIRTGKIEEADYNKLRTKASELSKFPLFIDDSGALTISAIRTRARRLKRKHNLSILFIDYLQLVSGNAKKENRTLEISEITQGLKSLAKELNIPIIVLSQLSRAVESRDDKRPLLSDLRESGAIEQDSDVVMFIYRDEYYLERKQPQPGTEDHSKWQEKLNQVHNQAEILVAKHRNGPIGNVLLFYNPECSKFENYVGDQIEQISN